MIDPLHVLPPKYLRDLDAVGTVLEKAAARHPELVAAEAETAA